jgi:thymidylate synthase
MQMFIATCGSANDLFAAVCAAVINDGREVSPRGLATREILGADLCLTQPRRRFVDLPPTRVLNPAFAIAEALWILSGSDDAWIFQYNRNLMRFADDGRLQGAYGPRMRRWAGVIDQLDGVRQTLSRDPDSRQGVIQLYDPVRDTRGHRDVPCTLGYRFFIRAGRLDMFTTMRSQDAWLGLPYDLFATTLLHELMAGWLGVDLGSYHHHVDSLHLYQEHVDAAAYLPEITASEAMDPLTVAWNGLPALLSGVIGGDAPPDATSGWTTFAAVLASYRRWSDGDRGQARTAASEIAGCSGEALGRWYDRLEPAGRVAAQTVAS